MRIDFDPVKRAWTLRNRSLDFLRVEEVFSGVTVARKDTRGDYGETRYINTAGILDERMVIVVWTLRSGARRIIRPMNERSRDIRENRVDPDDAPELMDEFFAYGEWKIGDSVVSRSEGETEVRRKLRGRPPQETRKTPISIRLSPKVVSHFRATGKGWQTRIDAALIEWMREHG